MSTIQPRPGTAAPPIVAIAPDRPATVREIVTVRWRVYAGGLSKVLPGVVPLRDEHGEAEIGLTVSAHDATSADQRYELAAWIVADVSGESLRIPIAALNSQDQDIAVVVTDASIDVAHRPSGASWLKATRLSPDDAPRWAQSEALMTRLELTGGQYHLVG